VQAEDGIRDRNVTGVQTCALPILPHPLVEAFHSTLEEALCADLIVVVSDVSSPFYHQQRETVFAVLDQLGAGDKPVLEALNKARSEERRVGKEHKTKNTAKRAREK